MRSGSKRLMIGFGSFLIAAAMVAPSFAAKKAVSDDELDMVTAAGQPTVIQAGGSLTVTFNATTEIVQILQTGSQDNLRALALNNVLGENQVANGINISGGAGPGTNGAQANNINQSWGATADISIVTAPGGTATATVINSDAALINKATAASSPGVTNRIRLSSAADILIHAGSDATVTYNPFTNISMVLEDGSQNSLVALVVNNVVGLNQVGNGVNLAGGSTVIGPDVSVTNNTGIGPSGQSNLLGAWRGTVQGFTRVP